MAWGPNPWPCRRLWAHIYHLPRESATAHALDAAAATWGHTEELLAAVVEQLDAGNRLFYSVHKDPKSGQKDPEPIQIRRPWQPEPEKPKLSSKEEVVAFFKGRVRKV